jgi:hypothetical protein
VHGPFFFRGAIGRRLREIVGGNSGRQSIGVPMTHLAPAVCFAADMDGESSVLASDGRASADCDAGRPHDGCTHSGQLGLPQRSRLECCPGLHVLIQPPCKPEEWPRSMPEAPAEAAEVHLTKARSN